MTFKRLSLIVTLACAGSCGGLAQASLIPLAQRAAFHEQSAAEAAFESDNDAAEAPALQAPATRARSVRALEPARFDASERGGFFNEFIFAALGPLGKSELASSIHALSASLKPYLESQGAYTDNSSQRGSIRLADSNAVVLAREFNYYGVLTTTKNEAAAVVLESRTRPIDPVLVERGAASEANPIMQGVISFFSQLFRSLAGIFSA